MSNPASFAVKRPMVVALVALLLLIHGYLSFLSLPRQENPALRDRFAQVVTYLPGAEPEKVERLVSEVLEDAIAEVDDIEEIVSRSVTGASWLLIVVDKSAPGEERLQEIRQKVQEARERLPDEASEPSVDTRVTRTNTLVLALVGEGVSAPALRHQARDLERRLERLADVRRVEHVGLPSEEVSVAVDLRALSQRGLTLADVVDALAARNVQLPSGELEVGDLRSTIQTSGSFEALGAVAELSGVFLGAGPRGLPIRLGDVARVSRQVAEPDAIVRAGGKRAVAFGLEMMPGRSALAFGERIRGFLAEHEPRLPPGMRIEIVADEPAYVGARLSLLFGSLLFGLGIVVTLSFLGLGWRSGAVVSLTIPLAMTVAMAFQGLLGIPLHQISIAALVIAIGIVVDESIVVTDNIQRHLDRGSSPREAAVNGLGEIHLAVIAGAATTVAAFIPLMIMRGDVGDFIRSIPVVVSAMLLGSVLVSHFLTPLLSVAVHRVAPTRGSGGLWARLPLEGAYRRVIAAAVRRPGFVLAGFFAGFVAAIGLFGAVLWPPAFFPDADRHQFMIRASLPPGAPLTETDAVMSAIEARLEGDPDVASFTVFVGEDAPKFYYNEFKGERSKSVGQVIVNTHEHVAFHETRGVVDRIDADLKANIPGAFVRANPLKQGYAGGDAIVVYVMGDDLDVLRTLASRVREIIEGVAGVRDVWDSFGYDPITIQAVVDDARANWLGIPHRAVATNLRSAVDGVVATTLREEDEEIPIRVRLAEGQRGSVAALSSLPLHSPAHGRTVPLSQVATLEPGFTTGAILRFQRQRESVVRASIEGDAALLAVAEAVEEAVRSQIDFPPGYHASFHGQPKDVTESFVSLLQAAVFAVFLIYIILVVRFQSIAQPCLIVLAIPMSLMGASLGLAATGNPFSFMAFLGMISLAGIAVNDSIVLVDTVNRLRRDGTAVEDAVREAGRLRLRAVVMTSVTTIGGLLPLAIGGGAFWSPFGFAMIFGLGASTVLTLIVLPSAYLLVERLRRGRAPSQAV